MKKTIYLMLSLIYFSCTQKVDVVVPEYKYTAEEQMLKGAWRGNVQATIFEYSKDSVFVKSENITLVPEQFNVIARFSFNGDSIRTLQGNKPFSYYEFSDKQRRFIASGSELDTQQIKVKFEDSNKYLTFKNSDIEVDFSVSSHKEIILFYRVENRTSNADRLYYLKQIFYRVEPKIIEN